MNYYNEFDPKAAAWIRQLIADGLIPPGDVDIRSITEIKPDELKNYTQCHFFAGIAGWAFAIQLAGWPADEPVWTGSCPCQPFSAAGKGLGTQDERDLWPVFAELIRACRPPVVLGEQVASASVLGKAGKRHEAEAGKVWWDGVSGDLEAMGYTTGAGDIPAAGVGAPHIRQRLFWVAYADGQRPNGIDPLLREDGRQREDGDSTEAAGSCEVGGWMEDSKLPAQPRQRQQCREVVCDENANGFAGAGFWSDSKWHGCRDGKFRRIPAESGLLGVVDGIPEGVDFGWLESSFPLAGQIKGRVALLKGYGNAIVPQAAAEFVMAFMEASAND